MNAHERNQNGLTLFLHFYTEKACVRENLLFYPGEKRRIYLSGEKLQTAFPLEVILLKEGEIWKLNDRPLYKENFSILYTKAGEEIMVVLSMREEKLFPCGKVFLQGKREIQIGRAYRNEVFYDCFSFVKDRHFILRKEQDMVYLENQRDTGTDKDNRAYVYLNGRRAPAECVLVAGDRIEYLGLTLIYLPGVLVCTSFYGALRTAEERKRMFTAGQAGNLPYEDKAEEMELAVIEEEQLVSEEMDLELPESAGMDSSQPLLLTVGPAITMVIPMMLMAMLGSLMSGGSGSGYYRISAVTTGACAFLSAFWAVTGHLYRKKVSRKENTVRVRSYEEYLRETERFLEDSFLHNRRTMQERYPSAGQILTGKDGNGQILWNNFMGKKEKLFVRLGLGDIPFQIRVRLSGTGRRRCSDEQTKKAVALTKKYEKLTQVPVGVDLKKHRLVGFSGEMIYPVFLQAILQLAACYGADRVKLVFFFHEESERENQIAECIKWLPHVWNQSRKVRYLAGNEREAGELIPELTRELQSREEDGDTPCDYVFLLAAPEMIRGEGIYRFLMSEKESRGTYIFFLCRERDKMPGVCECMVVRDRGRSELACYEQEISQREIVALEGADAKETEKYMRRLSSRNSAAESRREELTDQVTFLELYDSTRVEDLNCLGRWRENQTTDRIKVPIGKARGGRMIFLDVHEKFHGPHGLVAGTTGSGKSELLQTYLLSLAVSFGPEDINFFIIDYKGGGMGNMLQSLPHCAGVISNLSGSQIRRSLASIKSENLRRQRLFGEAGVNHVGDYAGLYREGKVSEPVPHLLLVIDEFAELKKEEPEFMQEIISVAQVGRSLGVHLILATQKPAGTVDDKIFSNTRFRLCLRVADRQDSMDMLHRPEAASLTGAGQCYLQVGNNELYELFQTAYSGADYEESKNADKGVCLLSRTGKRYYCQKEKGKKGPAQIEAVIDYIGKVAKEASLKAAKPLWMPELKEKIFLSDILKEEESREREIRICLGMCDDPERQEQYPLHYHPLTEGNLLLCGAPAVGKSTFLQTVLYQLCRYPVREVCFLLLSSDYAGVNCFESMPGCLGNLKKKEEAECFFYHLGQLFQKRKEELKGMNFQQYRRHEKKTGPFYFLIIDNYGSFRQMTEDRYGELIEKIAGEGQNYGFYLMITALNAGAGEIPGKLFEKMKVTMSLEMSDRFQYGDILRRYHMPLLPRENVKGRGLCKAEGRILEFQVPLCLDGEDDYGRVNGILTLAKERLGEEKDRLPDRFPVIPEKPVFAQMSENYRKVKESGKKLPLGYSKRSGNIAAVPLGKSFSFLISGAEQSGKRNLLCCMIRALWEKEIEVAVFDRKNEIRDRVKRMAQDCEMDGFIRFLESSGEFVNWYDSIKRRKQEREDRECFLCISDLNDFSSMFCGRENDMLEIRQDLEQKKDEQSMLPVIAILKQGREMEAVGTPVYDFMQKQQCGIHLGGNAAGCRTLSFDDLSYTRLNQWEKPGTGYLKKKNGSKTEVVYIPLCERENEDDSCGYSGSEFEQNL